MGKVSESIFSGATTIIPLADVQHIEKWGTFPEQETTGQVSGIKIITKHTRWNFEQDCWDNNIYLNRDEAQKFLNAWCNYRAELESETLKEHH